MPLRCATMRRKDDTKYVFCTGKKGGKPAKANGNGKANGKKKKGGILKKSKGGEWKA